MVPYIAPLHKRSLKVTDTKEPEDLVASKDNTTKEIGQCSNSSNVELFRNETTGQLCHPAAMVHFNQIQKRAGTARGQPNEHKGYIKTKPKKKSVKIGSKHCLPPCSQ